MGRFIWNADLGRYKIASLLLAMTFAVVRFHTTFLQQKAC